MAGKEGPVAWHSEVDHDPDPMREDMAATRADPCQALEEEVEVLEDQVAVLEEGLPGAPGAQKTALAKEINEYRGKLDATRTALRRCRGAREQASDRTT
jgi:hypothetical protein